MHRMQWLQILLQRVLLYNQLVEKFLRHIALLDQEHCRYLVHRIGQGLRCKCRELRPFRASMQQLLMYLNHQRMQCQLFHQLAMTRGLWTCVKSNGAAD